MDVTAVATVAVRETEGISSCFQVLVSKDIGNDELVGGIDELKTLHILHQDFPKTIPEYRRTYMGNHVCLHMPVVKDEEKECEKERASGVLLYLEDRFDNNNMDNRIKNLEKFPVIIQDVLNRYSNVFDTSIKKTMNVPDAELNLVDGYRPTRCYTCRPTPLHYMETADKLLADLMTQGVIEEAGDTRSEWCSPAHFVPKPNRVPLALRLVCDFTNLNSYLTRDQPATFPTGDDIRKQLGSDCKVWACIDCLSAYYQVKIRPSDVPKTCFLVNNKRFQFLSTVMGNKLSSDTWLRASDEVTNGLPGTFKLVDDILIGATDYEQLSVRLEALLVRCDAADMTLSSNKVQVGEKVTFAGYVLDGATVYADPAKVEAITRYPEPTKLKELRGWFGLTNQMQNYVPGLAGKQKKLRSLLNKGVTFWIDEEMREELEKTKQAISDNILLNNFCMKRATVVITDASGDGFAFILLQYTGGGYIVIQVGSAAIKKVWKSYSALELEGTCVIWSIESLKFYRKGLASFELWTDHSPLKDAMLKPLRDLSPRLQKFRWPWRATVWC